MSRETKLIINGDATGLVRAAGQGEAAITRLGRSVGALESLAGSALGLTSLGVAASSAAAFLVSSTTSAVEAADAVANLSQRTGLAASEINKLQFAATLSDISNEQLAKGLTALSVKMTEAGTGSGQSAKLFEKYAIAVRNSDGTLRTSREVLDDWADVFATLPDGAEKSALAVELFGKKVGVEMIPLLNSGAAGLKAMGDEAERLGLVMSDEFTKAAEEFNDNLDRLKKNSQAAGISIGSSLVPALNEVVKTYLDASRSGVGGLTNLFLIEKAVGVDAEKQIGALTQKIEALKKARDDAAVPFLSAGQGKDSAGLEGQIAALEKVREFYRAQAGKSVADDQEAAAKRLQIEQKLQRERAGLEQLRAVAAGKVSADILQDDGKRTDEQVKNAQKLRQALEQAWRASRDEARKAADEAAALLAKAANIRQTGADRAADRRNAGLSDAEKGALAQREFDAAAQEAAYKAAAAQAAAIDGRAEVSKKYAEAASKAAERAADFAGRITDDEAAARAIEQAADLQARLVESQAKAKEREAVDLQQRAEDQAATLRQLDEQITALQTKAAAIKVDADITAAMGNIATLEAKLSELDGKTVTMTVVQQTVASDINSAGLGGFEIGGFTGMVGRRKIAGFVHGQEHVMPAHRTMEPGALAILELWRKQGLNAVMSSLNVPGYFNGGLVSRLSMPSVRAGGGGSALQPVNLYLDGNRYAMSAQPETVATLKSFLGREALRKGGR